MLSSKSSRKLRLDNFSYSKNQDHIIFLLLLFNLPCLSFLPRIKVCFHLSNPPWTQASLPFLVLLICCLPHSHPTYLDFFAISKVKRYIFKFSDTRDLMASADPVRDWERPIFHDLSLGTVITQPWAHNPETYIAHIWKQNGALQGASPESLISNRQVTPSFLQPHLEAHPCFGVIFNLHAFLSGLIAQCFLI